MKKLFLCIVAAICVLPSSAVEWKASWIGSPWEGEEFDKALVQPAPLFRKQVNFDKKVVNATAYVTGVGFFEFYVNGKKMGEDVLMPNETSYGHREGIKNFDLAMDDTNWRNFRVQYYTFDVTKYLRKGANAFAATLGNGFYSIGRVRWVDPYGSPRFICQIEIEYADGSKETVVSDASWLAAKGPIVHNDLYEGEVYDARKAIDGWNDVDCPAEGWTAAVIRKAPDGKLCEMDGAPDRIIEVLKPYSIKKLENGNWEVDFNDYVSGWVRLKNFQLPEGAEVELEFPTESPGNGVYKYISDGSAVKEYAPRFCWWVFYKVIVKGWQGELKASNIQAEVVHSYVPVNAHFACSNELFNRINEIWKRTQTDNMHLSVPTDCPHREKGPYTGGGEVSCPTVMHNFDAYAFYRKWMRDMSDVQDTVTGYVPNGAPWHPGCGGGVAWGSAMCIVPWEFYMRYADKELLAENYVQMKEYVRFLSGWRLDNGTVFQQIPSREKPFYWYNLGEWCPPYNLTSENLVHTWYLWRCASFTAKAAEVLGQKEDASKYSAMAAEVAEAFHKTFYSEEIGGYYSGTGITASDGYGTGNGGGVGDGSNIFALEMGVPADRYDKVIAKVKEELKANNGHLNTGIFGTALFFDVLCKNGMAEEAYEAMNKRDFPGFGWWVEQGAMTTWEQWNGKDSRCHPMFGGALVWLYRDLAGLQAAEPGYKKILFKPTPVGDITWASYDIMTPQGKAAIKWTLKEKKLTVKVEVPQGSAATIVLPDGKTSEVGAGKTTVTTVLH